MWQVQIIGLMTQWCRTKEVLKVETVRLNKVDGKYRGVREVSNGGWG